MVKYGFLLLIKRIVNKKTNYHRFKECELIILIFCACKMREEIGGLWYRLKCEVQIIKKVLCKIENSTFINFRIEGL